MHEWFDSGQMETFFGDVCEYRVHDGIAVAWGIDGYEFKLSGDPESVFDKLYRMGYRE